MAADAVVRFAERRSDNGAATYRAGSLTLRMRGFTIGGSARMELRSEAGLLCSERLATDDERARRRGGTRPAVSCWVVGDEEDDDGRNPAGELSGLVRDLRGARPAVSCCV